MMALRPAGPSDGEEVEMSSKWYVDPEAGAVEAEDEQNYDEAFGPENPHPVDGRIVEDDEGVHEDTTKEAVAHVAVGDDQDLSAEEAAIHIVDENW